MVPLPRSLLVELQRHLDGQVPARTEALLFTSRTGGPVRYRSLRRSFDAACRRVGLLGVTPHSLRASCASWVAESDGVLEAARRLGHSRSSVTTRHYARPLAGGDRVAADHLDAARTAARSAAAGASMDPGVARVWHEDLDARNDTAVSDEGHPR
jgi:integrase